MIPTWEKITSPILKLCYTHKSINRKSELLSILSDQFALTDEEKNKMTKNGNETLFHNAVRWAVFQLDKAGLIIINNTEISITDYGRTIYSHNPELILNQKYLKTLPKYKAWFTKSKRVQIKDDTINYWAIRAGLNAEYWKSWLEGNYVSINYCGIPDLSKLESINEKPTNQLLIDEINSMSSNKIIIPVSKSIESQIVQCKLFYKIKQGDKIIALKNNNTILGHGTIISQYYHNTTNKQCHSYDIQWHNANDHEIDKINYNKTIHKISKSIYYKAIHDIFPNSEYDEYLKILKYEKQLIFYGPPGTGKTFIANEIANRIIDNNIKQKITYKQAILKVLKNSNKEMTSKEILKEILNQKLIKTSGMTPRETIGSLIYTDIKQKGDNSFFTLTQPGLFKLNKYVNNNMGENIENQKLFKKIITFHQ